LGGISMAGFIAGAILALIVYAIFECINQAISDYRFEHKLREIDKRYEVVNREINNTKKRFR
jgi:hypothetical protein